MGSRRWFKLPIVGLASPGCCIWTGSKTSLSAQAVVLWLSINGTIIGLRFFNQARAWFPKIDPVRIVCMCVCVCVRPRGY